SPADELGPSALGSCPEQMMGSSSRMQGKELSEQATVAKSSVGIDVGKSWLDIHVLPSAETLRVANTREGVRKLKRWLAGFDVALIVVEATGKWHRQVRRSLHTEGFAVAVVPLPKRKAFSPRPIASMPACWRCSLPS